MPGFFRLDINDLVKGGVTAVFAAVIITIAGVAQQPGFNVFQADWGQILGSALNVGITTLVAYISKNLLTDSKGNVLGAIPTTTKE